MPNSRVSLQVLATEHHLALTLDRPQVRNALDVATMQAITHAVTHASASVRTISIAGAGKSFCAGADLNWMGSAVSNGSSPSTHSAAHDVAALDEMFAALQAAPQVVVVQAHGACRGGGAGLLAIADIVVAEPDTTVAFPEVALGLVPAVIAPYVLARIGPAAARWLMLSGEVIAASRAQALGLVQHIAPPDELEAVTQALLKNLWRKGPQALRTTKALLRALPGLDDAAGRAHALATIAQVRAGAEAQEGCAAYLGKRAPSFGCAS